MVDPVIGGTSTEDKLQLIKNEQTQLEAALKRMKAKAEAEGRTLLTEEGGSQLNRIFSQYANTLKMEKAIWEGEDKDFLPKTPRATK